MNNPIIEFLVEALILADSLPRDPAPLLAAALPTDLPVPAYATTGAAGWGAAASGRVGSASSRVEKRSAIGAV